MNIALLLLMGCQPDAPATLFPVEDAAPPVIDLQTGPLTRGSDATVSISLPIGNLQAWLVQGTAVGSGPCPAALNGACLGVTRPAIAATTVGDAQGEVTWTVPISDTAPDTLAWQGVVEYRGNYYTTTALTVDVGDPLEPGLHPAYFDPAGLAAPITEEACTLSNGSVTTCYRIELLSEPSDHDVGPFCPRNIAEDATEGGIWLESGSVHDVDGSFIENLATFYGDPGWQMYDPVTGDINVTETLAECEAAARPDVDPAYFNYCVECNIDDISPVVTTLLIPTEPEPLTTPQEFGMITELGAALNGVVFAPPAPVDAILSAYTIAAFDDCGGHVNTAAGYHYHAAMGCSQSIASGDGHAPLVGYALDGYSVHSMLNEDGNEPTDLDACRGHEDARGYHYHTAGPGENMILGCFHGATEGASTPTGPGGGTPGVCATPTSTMCCGDGVCDGPETAATCAADCP